MNEQLWILGISASHNGCACLLRGDEIVVATIACLLNTGLDCCIFEDRIVFKA